MGHMRVTLRLSNPDRPELSESLSDALVDTGATFTTIPRAVSERLALRRVRQRQIRTAAGPQTLDESYALFEYDGNRTVTPVLLTDALDFVLVGVITLEALSLTVDPTTGELRESEAYLL
jgi:aspartyl protease family protein